MHSLRLRNSVGQYDLVRALGSGGMGVVYEARHRALGRRVAIKLLRANDPALPGAALASARFLREGRAAAQVQHPHVVDVFDIGVEDGVPFLVMELVLGETFAQRIARDGALPLATTVELLLPVVSAVAELHAAGIVHRDLKPANILLARGRSGETVPKVADFGVSRLDDGSIAITDGSAVIGTYAYMAPEQALSSKGASELSDLYSLGVILYECATGKKPFEGHGPLGMVDAIVHAPLAPPSAANPALPPAFDALVLRVMNRDAAARFGSAEELGEALLAFAEPAVARRWEGEFAAPRSQSVREADDGSSSIRSVISTPKPPATPRAAIRRSTAAACGLVVLLAVAMTMGRARTVPHPDVAAAPSPALEISRATIAAPASESACASAPVPAPARTSESAHASPSTPARPPSAKRAPRPVQTASPPLDNGAPILDPE